MPRDWTTLDLWCARSERIYKRRIMEPGGLRQPTPEADDDDDARPAVSRRGPYREFTVLVVEQPLGESRYE